MPSVNPLIDQAVAAPLLPAGQLAQPSAGQVALTEPAVQPVAADQATQVNAAGTTENVALHVALWVAAAMIGVYVLRQSGFKFVVAGSVG